MYASIQSKFIGVGSKGIEGTDINFEKRKDCKNPMKASKTPNKMLNLILGWFREKPLWLMLRAYPNANKTSQK